MRNIVKSLRAGGGTFSLPSKQVVTAAQNAYVIYFTYYGAMACLSGHDVHRQIAAICIPLNLTQISDGSSCAKSKRVTLLQRTFCWQCKHWRNAVHQADISDGCVRGTRVSLYRIALQTPADY